MQQQMRRRRDYLTIALVLLAAVVVALITAQLSQASATCGDVRIVRCEGPAIRVDCDRADVLCDDEGA